MRSLGRLTVIAVLLLSSTVAARPAEAFHGTHWTTCVGAATDCIVSTSLPAGISVDVFLFGGSLNVQVRNAANVGNEFELAPAATTSSTIGVTVRPGASFTPAAVVSTGHIVDWTWNGTTRDLVITAQPRASSWSLPDPCLPGSCPTTADRDFTAFLLIAAEDTIFESAPAFMWPEIATFMTKFTGGYMATNAQYASFPSYDPSANAVRFDLGAPHFKVGGSVVNTGFFRILVPNPVISDLWGLDPATMSSAQVSVDVGGVPVSITPQPVAARGVLPAGWLWELLLLSYSTPTVTLKPATASGVEDAPVVIPAQPGGQAVRSTRPVLMPRSGAVGVPVTLSTGAASIALGPGTIATLDTAVPFAGVLFPPYRVPDRTGGRAVSVHHIGLSGLGPDSEVRFSVPLTITLPAPEGDDAAAYQPVAIAQDGSLTFLLPTNTSASVSMNAVARTVTFAVDRLRAGINHFGLARVAKPEVVAVERSVAADAGFHSRWAGQSRSVELSRGQLVDLAVRFRNTGSEAWVRGEPGRQANLGSAAPLDNLRDHERGILIAPTLGQTRYATTAESTVPSGGIGTFAMRLRAPAQAGTYRIYVRPVIEGTTWLEDEGVYLELVVR